MLLWTGMRVHTSVSGRIDRAFFREAYDARVILEDLAAHEPPGTGRTSPAAARLTTREALHPSFVLFGSPRTCASRPVDGRHRRVDFRRTCRCRGVEQAACLGGHRNGDRVAAALPPGPDCLVPFLGRTGDLVGLIVLGARLSEEPYSGEDYRLLASVASQAGMALENMRLAENRERLERDRRVAREMEIAKEVQARLLPAAAPVLGYAQWRRVRPGARGWRRLLRLPRPRPLALGLVLADVSGKGIHAALLMANLQAHLRDQFGIAPHDPGGALERVNRLLYGSTASHTTRRCSSVSTTTGRAGSPT